MVLESSWIRGKTLENLNIPARTGAVVIAVVRGNKPQPNPDPKFVALKGDIFILLGSHTQLDQSLKTLEYGDENEKEKVV